MIAAVVAMSENKVIGDSNDLPWYLPADLARFREITTGHTIVMGRKTWDSIIARNGKPLPNRTNVVVTRDPNFAAEGAVVLHDLKQALQTDTEVYVVGGAQIFKQALPYLDRIYLTQVNATIKGDTLFPELNMKQWREMSHEPHPADAKNQYPYTFLILDKTDANAT